MPSIKDIFNTITRSNTEQPPRVCKHCNTEIPYTEYLANQGVCPSCGTYFRLRAVERLDITIDKHSFQEIDKKLRSKDPIGFPDYAEKLEKAEKLSGLTEGVVCGTAKISGFDCAIFVCEWVG